MSFRTIHNNRLIDGEKLDKISLTYPINLDEIPRSIEIGTTTTGAAWTDAEVTNSWTPSNQILDFIIPRGADGINGVDGTDWNWIDNISLISTVGKAKTYRIIYTDSTTFDFVITDWTDGTNWTNWTNGTDGTDWVDWEDGRGIVSVTLTSWAHTQWTTDTYTITYTDTTTSTFQVYNGANGAGTIVSVTGTMVDNTDPANPVVNSDSTKQDTLVSGTNIKTINGNSVLGAWDIEIIGGGGGWFTPVYLTALTSAVVPAYKQTSYTADVAETILTGTANNNEVLVQSYLFDTPIGLTSIPPGTWTFDMYGYVSSAAGDTRVRIETFKRTSAGVETTLFSTTSSEINNTTRWLLVFTSTTQPAFTINTTDYIGTRIYVSTTATINRTVSIIVGDGNASYFTTPLPIRASQVRNVQAGTISATDVQGALNELDSEKSPIASPTFTGTVTTPAIKITGWTPWVGKVLTSDADGDGTWETPSAGGSTFWTAMPGTPTRVGNTSFTVTGDVTAYVAKGMIIKWTESGVIRVGMVSTSTYSSPNTAVTIIGDIMISIDVASLKYMAQDPYIANFAVAWSISATGTDVCNVFYANEPYRVIGAELSTGTVASTSGNTIIDININGATAFSTKPTIAYNALTTATPFTANTWTSLSLNNRVSIDIDTVCSTTFPVDMYVKLYLVPTRYVNLT